MLEYKQNSIMENVRKVHVPFKENEAWQTLFFGKDPHQIKDRINAIWFANVPYEFVLIPKSLPNPKQLNIIFDEEPNNAHQKEGGIPI